MSKKSIRRHHKFRIRRKALRKCKEWGWGDECALYKAENLAYCSCPSCGNPRKHEKGNQKLTIQERINIINFKEQIKEFYQNIKEDENEQNKKTPNSN